MKTSLFLALVLAMSSVGCIPNPRPHGHDHGHGGHAPHGGHDGHGHGREHGYGRAHESATLWGIQTQLFVRYPALVVGQGSTFDANLTVWSGHAPLESGAVVVELASDDHPTERFQIDAPEREGLFRPVVTPEHAGLRQVTLRVESEQASETHDLGLLVVHATPEEAEAASQQGAGSDTPTIAFPLERQWRTPFRLEGAVSRPMRPNIPAFAHLERAPSTQAVADQDPPTQDATHDELILSVGVAEAYVGRLGDVSGAWFRVDPNQPPVDVPADAFVSIGTEIDATHRTLPVRFRVPDTSTRLFAGQRMLAHLIVDAPRRATAVPVDAVVDDSGTDVVYVQVDGESFERRPVRLGLRDGRHVEVLEGVSPGEWVVSKGAWSVRLAATSTDAIGHGHAH